MSCLDKTTFNIAKVHTDIGWDWCVYYDGRLYQNGWVPFHWWARWRVRMTLRKIQRVKKIEEM